jgi:hypothetical protein
MPLLDLLAPFIDDQPPPVEVSNEVLEEHAVIDSLAAPAGPEEEAGNLLKSLQNKARTLKARQQRWRNQIAARLQRQNPTPQATATASVPDFVLEASRYLTLDWKRLGATNQGRHRRPQTRALWSYLFLIRKGISIRCICFACCYQEDIRCLLPMC